MYVINFTHLADMLIHIQLSYAPLLLYVTMLNISDLSTYSLMIVISTKLEYVIESRLVEYLLIKRIAAFQINILKEIVNSRILMTAVISIVAMNIAFRWLVMYYVMKKEFFEKLMDSERLRSSGQCAVCICQ